ncbi:MAG: Smr/MutS family protein [Muribaculaceae bacterium]|nr:Smr/MutS family protein [Muribaculaceae bacterium]
MIYPNNFEQKIGFDKIRNKIKERCLSPLGEEAAEQITFSTNYNNIIKMVEECNEFLSIIESEKDFPCDHFYDVRIALKRLKVVGTYIDTNELFDLRRSLSSIINIINFLRVGVDEERIQYPRLKTLTDNIITFPDILKQADRIIDKFGYIKDSASPALYDIRREITSKVNSISRNLANILKKAREEGIVEKDVTPTMRDGRLVIPVVPAHKRKIKGIVHDESASGKTVFIEPAEVVEANNRIRELESEERREIVKILTEFSDVIRPHIDDMIYSYLFMGEIDLIRAKAIFAKSIGAVMPKIDNYCQIDWYGAVHPLLFLSLKRQNKKVIPLDICLDKDKRILIISGPNAGGKSVCLKTVGLLQYMIQCGMLVPMFDNSRVGIFNDIFIDIGDEQSIEDDLSTYSSHLTNMKNFVRNCNEKSLLLIDEFGGGTEPRIGGAIAEALLNRFNAKKSFGVITTHYQNLKQFAEDNDGIINGAMLYDRHIMQPLFKLSIGNPGSSFAIEIARKIGLPEDVIAEASDIVGQEYVSMDKYLQDIVRDKRYWEQKRQNVRMLEKRLEDSIVRYEKDILSLEKERKEIIKGAKVEASNILSETNAKIENTIRQIKEAQAEKERTKAIREEMRKFKEEISDKENQNSKLSKKIERLNKNNKNKKKDKEQIKPIDEAPLAIGDVVKLKDGGSVAGEILEINGKNITVGFGTIKSVVKIDKLERANRSQLKRQNTKTQYYSSPTTDMIRNKQLSFSSELDVRGMRGDEAIETVAAFIDTAILSGYSNLRILHGTGNGILQQLIRSYLKKISAVKSFREEDVQLGGAGITVVELY